MNKPLYFGDSGRVTCSDLGCAGMTAHYSKMKRDLSGGGMDRVTRGDLRQAAAMGIVLRCETCKAEASVLAVAS